MRGSQERHIHVLFQEAVTRVYAPTRVDARSRPEKQGSEACLWSPAITFLPREETAPCLSAQSPMGIASPCSLQALCR